MKVSIHESTKPTIHIQENGKHKVYVYIGKNSCTQLEKLSDGNVLFIKLKFSDDGYLCFEIE